MKGTHATGFRWGPTVARPGVVELLAVVSPRGGPVTRLAFWVRAAGGDDDGGAFRSTARLRIGYRVLSGPHPDPVSMGRVHEGAAYLAGREDDLLSLVGQATARLTLADLHAPARDVLDGLVRGLDPATLAARRLDLRLHVLAPCDCRCLFCEPAEVAPARPTTADDPRLDRFAKEVLPALADRFRDVRLTLAAGDPLAHPGVVPMLGGLDRGLRMRVRLDTPGTLLADGAVARSLASVRVPVEVRVALLGATAATHDAVAGRPGGHELVTAGLAALAAAGVPCSFVSVLVARNLPELPALAAAAVAAGRKLHLAYPRASGAPGRRAAPGVRAPIDDVRAAVAAALPSLQECLAGATGLPACALPPTLRPLRSDGPGSGRADAGLAACGRCASLQSCVGVDAEYVQEFGERGLEPFA